MWLGHSFVLNKKQSNVFQLILIDSTYPIENLIIVLSKYLFRINTHQAKLFIIKIIAQKILSFVEHPVLISTPAAWPYMPPLGAE